MAASRANLFQPIRLGPLTLKNRLVMTAMSTGFADDRGEVSERLIEYYARRARGGVALVTVEEAYIHPMLPHIRSALGIFADHLLPGLRRLSDRLHREGALASLQIGLYFRQALHGFPRFAASSSAPDCAGGCLELTRGEIKYLTELFVSAAARTRAAGFDAVEIHACHGCIISEFLSPYWNQRPDEYGGSRENRFRFALEILRGIRQELGPDYPVIYRISGSEFAPEGFSPEDAVALAAALEADGVSAINISGGLGHINHISIPPSDVERGLLLPIGRQVKEAVRVPVIVGNSMTPEIAAKAIAAGDTDLIGLGRPLIADPEWPRKVAAGREEDIRRCLRCNQGCFGALRDPSRRWIACLYNPEAGREFEQPLTPAAVRKKVVVVGGGPAGCEAARVVRLRGHQVILLEKENRLGGQFCLASVPPKKADFGHLVDFYRRELARLGVEVRLGTRATPELLEELAADVYVLATGAVPVRPKIPGSDLPHVVTAHQVLAGTAAVDQQPVVVIGGGAAGLETADYLAFRGLEVTVVEMLDRPGRDLIDGIGVREALLARLQQKKVQILCGHRAMAIDEEAVLVSDRPLIGGGRQRRLPAKTVVLALGVRPEDSLYPGAEKGGAVWYRVGDCRHPGNALSAIHQAFDLARQI